MYTNLIIKHFFKFLILYVYCNNSSSFCSLKPSLWQISNVHLYIHPPFLPMSKLQSWLWGGFSSASNLIFDWELNLQPSTAQFTTPPHNNTLLLICGVGHQHVDIINGKPEQTTTKFDAINIFLRNQESQVPWKLKVSSTAFLAMSKDAPMLIPAENKRMFSLQLP